MSEHLCPVCNQPSNETDTTPLMLAAMREQIDRGMSDKAIITIAQDVLKFCREFDRRWEAIEAANGDPS